MRGCLFCTALLSPRALSAQVNTHVSVSSRAQSPYAACIWRHPFHVQRGLECQQANYGAIVMHTCLVRCICHGQCAWLKEMRLQLLHSMSILRIGEQLDVQVLNLGPISSGGEHNHRPGVVLLRVASKTSAATIKPHFNIATEQVPACNNLFNSSTGLRSTKCAGGIV